MEIYFQTKEGEELFNATSRGEESELFELPATQVMEGEMPAVPVKQEVFQASSKIAPPQQAKPLVVDLSFDSDDDNILE